MRRAVFLGLAALVAACATAPELGMPTGEDRQAAEQFAQRSITDRFPDYPVTATGSVADCIVNNATDEEVMLLAGRVPATTEKNRQTLAVAVAQRPAAQACIANNNVPPLG